MSIQPGSLRASGKRLPLFAAAPYMRSCLGAWPFAARFGQEADPCVFCGRDHGSRLMHVSACSFVGAWFESELAELGLDVKRGKFSIFLGAHRAISPDVACALACAHACLFEAWSMLHHGSARGPPADLVRNRVRALATRSPAAHRCMADFFHSLR